jgi:hypothetical protein
MQVGSVIALANLRGGYMGRLHPLPYPYLFIICDHLHISFEFMKPLQMKQHPETI